MNECIKCDNAVAYELCFAQCIDKSCKNGVSTHWCFKHHYEFVEKNIVVYLANTLIEKEDILKNPPDELFQQLNLSHLPREWLKNNTVFSPTRLKDHPAVFKQKSPEQLEQLKRILRQLHLVKRDNTPQRNKYIDEFSDFSFKCFGYDDEKL